MSHLLTLDGNLGHDKRLRNHQGRLRGVERRELYLQQSLSPD